MMKSAEIKNGIVVNIALVDNKQVADVLGYVLCGDAEIGWSYENGLFSPPAPSVSTLITLDENIAAIKAKAGEIIITRLPDYKQRNYLARKAELQDILIAGNLLSKGEQAEWDFLTAEWTWAKSIRAASNEAEAAGTPVAEIVWPV